MLANDEHAKEVKLFGLGPLLLGRYARSRETFYREDQRARGASAPVVGVRCSRSLGTGAFYGCYAVDGAGRGDAARSRSAT